MKEISQPPKSHRELVAKLDSLVKELGLEEEPQTRAKRWILRIGELLRRVRVAAGIGQSELATRAALMQPYLSRLENGLPESGKVVRGPSSEVLLRWADALDCHIEFSFRSKATGEVLGQLSSAELSEQTVPTITKSKVRSSPAERVGEKVLAALDAGLSRARLWSVVTGERARLRNALEKDLENYRKSGGGSLKRYSRWKPVKTSARKKNVAARAEDKPRAYPK